MLKACAFDLGNTLINDAELQNMSITTLAERLFERKIIKSPTVFISVYNRINKQTEMPFLSHTFGEPVFFEKTFAELRINSISIDEILKNYREICTELMVINPSIKQALVLLKKKNIKIAILSNESTIRVETFLKKNKLESFFDTVLVSQTFGVEKPDVIIFEEIMKRLEVKSDEIAMFGDSDIADGACKKLGISFVLVSAFKKSGWSWERGNKHKPDYVMDKIDSGTIIQFLKVMG